MSGTDCPRCHGLLLREQEEGGKWWLKCSACSRRFPATKAPGPETGAIPLAPPPTPAPAQSNAFAGLRPLEAVLKAQEPQPVPDRLQLGKQRNDVRRCEGVQGRGRCKQEAAPGSPYCRAHAGQATVTRDVPRDRPPATRSVDQPRRTQTADDETPPNKIVALLDEALTALESEIVEMGERLATLQDKKHRLAKARAVLVEG